MVNRNEINVCLYIPDNMELYESFLANRESIDKAADIPLNWCELPERKASKIIIERPAELSDQSKWQDNFVATPEFRKAFNGFYRVRIDEAERMCMRCQRIVI